MNSVLFTVHLSGNSYTANLFKKNPKNLSDPFPMAIGVNGSKIRPDAPPIYQYTSYQYTSYQSPVTNHQLPITSYQSPVTNHQSPVTNHQSPVTNHQLPITSYQSPVTNHQLPVTSYQLPNHSTKAIAAITRSIFFFIAAGEPL